MGLKFFGRHTRTRLKPRARAPSRRGHQPALRSNVRPPLSFHRAGEYGVHLGPKRKAFLAFVRVQLVQLVRVTHTCQVWVFPPTCKRIANASAGSRRVGVQGVCPDGQIRLQPFSRLVSPSLPLRLPEGCCILAMPAAGEGGPPSRVVFATKYGDVWSNGSPRSQIDETNLGSPRVWRRPGV